MILSKVYADGFLEYAKETIGQSEALSELQDLRGIFRGNPELAAFLQNPAIGYAEKCASMDRIFGKSFSEETRSFIKLLLKKGRIDKFTDIAEYARIKYAHGEEVEARLNIGYPLDTDIIQSIKNKMEKRLGKKLHFYMNLEPELLGGVQVAVGNIVIDGSIKKRLEDLRDKLMAKRVS